MEWANSPVLHSRKLHAKNFIRYVLKPMIFLDLPRLYGNKWRDFTVHLDSSSSYTAGETGKWLKANKIKFIPAEKWTPNSQEVSPMDFSGTGT